MDDPDLDEEAIFNAAARIADSNEVAAYLAGACKNKPEMRQDIERLLRLSGRAQDAATAPSFAVADEPKAPNQTSTLLVVPLSESAGNAIGRYKLLQQIGEGGCGAVYMAEQEEPVRRRVALKIIKIGMDTKEVIARFEVERQALALMDHPNIAKVLDAGATDTGRPYFVMELVKGIPITRYCDENKLSTVRRLDLFIQVCQSIQHAHQKGIIHRDIKPSNILVADHDGMPVPKVIDFGIAKATSNQRLTDRTLFTHFGQFIGTPAYMSPEQARLSGLDIDTRSDIYSLGVLLYELLTGKTPFDAKRLIEAGLDEIRRIIREEEPLRPSTKLHALRAEEQTTVARQRQSEPPKLEHLLRGDLDWIVMKCLEKDRTRRYETANGLAMDLKRHLDNEPVLARPPNALYRLEKAFQRNKVVFAAAGAVAGALLFGITGTTIGLLRAEKQSRMAEAARQEQIRLREIAVRSLDGERQERTRAEAQELAARRVAYDSDMNLAQQALALNNLGRAQRLLNREKPRAGQRDLRGWEWRYLWSQTRADNHKTLFAGTNRLFRPLSFSADGTLLAREDEGATVVTDVISHSALFQRTNALRPVFSHRGTRLAFVEPRATNSDIVLADLISRQETRFTAPWKYTRWIGFTPDDRTLLTVSLQPGRDRSDDLPYALTAWDINAARKIWQRAIDPPSTDNGRPYAVSPNGTAIAAALLDGRAQVIETADGRERFTVKTSEELTTAVAFSPDNSILLTGAGYTDSTIRLWNARNGATAGSLDGHRSWVSDLLFTPNGKLLISSSGDQTIRLWNWSTLKPAGILRGHLDEIDGVAMAADGRTLASRCKDGSVYLWDVTEPSRHLGHQTLPGNVSYSAAVFTTDSKSILGTEWGGGAALWDAATLTEKRRLWGDSTNDANTVISQDARWVMKGDSAGRLHVWDVSSGLETTNFTVAPGRFHAWITRNGKFLLTRCGPVLENWETDTWQRKGSITIRVEQLFAACLSNSFVVPTDDALQIFDAAKLAAPPKGIKTRGTILAMTMSADGRIIAGAYEDGTVRLWDGATLQLLESLKGFLLDATSVAFSPDGGRLAASSAGSEAVKLWDAETWQEVLTLSGEGSGFGSLTFSPDGRFLVAINSGGLAHVWSAPTWADIATAETDEKRVSEP